MAETVLILLKMTHQFFQKSRSEQRKILWKTGGALFLICSFILVISYLTGFYLLAILTPIVMLIAAPFIDLPMGKKNGKFIYYSPLFITEPVKNNKVIVHGGTLFDYLYTVSPDLKGCDRTNYVLYGLLLGLIKFISEHENRDNDDLRIRGTSYIINQRTAARFGLKPVKTDLFQYIIMLFNYIPITLSYSFIKRKIHFPKISEIKTYQGELSELANNKQKLLHLKNLLEPK